jgi:AraC-like DNA-binding protein
MVAATESGAFRLLTHETLVRLCDARDRLRAADDTSPSIEQIAQASAMSRFHFIRRFSAVFGETPHQFRIRSRLERAKELLATGNISVTDVCMEVGFASLGSFSDLFTRRVGMPPSLYRHKARVVVPASWFAQPIPACWLFMGGEAGLAIFEKHRRRDRSDLHASSSRQRQT